MKITNPLLSKAVVYEKRLPAKTERLIGEIGLRYRPSAQADLHEHAAQLALLAADVADVPPDLLERAIRAHAQRSPYMPKASELIALAKSFIDPPQQARAEGGMVPDSSEHLAYLVDRLNSQLLPGSRRRWVAQGTDILLEAA
jgi:hypothetical protein